jgi:hypothetical protein
MLAPKEEDAHRHKTIEALTELIRQWDRIVAPVAFLSLFLSPYLLLCVFFFPVSLPLCSVFLSLQMKMSLAYYCIAVTPLTRRCHRLRCAAEH